jgi:hypothetical protein
MTEASQLVETLLNDEPGLPDPKAMAMQVADQEQAQQQAEKASGVVNQNTVHSGQTIWHRTHKNADGTATRVRITSVKTWKTRPTEFQIGWKYGMYDYGTIGPHNAFDWTTVEPPAVPRQKRRR